VHFFQKYLKNLFSVHIFFFSAIMSAAKKSENKEVQNETGQIKTNAVLRHQTV
jgi:hypothetical protein